MSLLSEKYASLFEPGFDYFAFVQKNTKEPSRALSMAQRHERLAKMAAAEEILAADNPVASLSEEAYLALLSASVQAERIAHGRMKTKTNIELAKWLDFKEGRLNREQFHSSFHGHWKWGEIVGLGVSPMMVFVYMRMAKEALEDRLDFERQGAPTPPGKSKPA